jgi:hypothetical protein
MAGTRLVLSKGKFDVLDPLSRVRERLHSEGGALVPFESANGSTIAVNPAAVIYVEDLEHLRGLGRWLGRSPSNTATP